MSARFVHHNEGTFNRCNCKGPISVYDSSVCMSEIRRLMLGLIITCCFTMRPPFAGRLPDQLVNVYVYQILLSVSMGILDIPFVDPGLVREGDFPYSLRNSPSSKGAVRWDRKKTWDMVKVDYVTI